MKIFYLVKSYLYDKFIVYDDSGRAIKRGLNRKEAEDYAKNKGAKPTICSYWYMVGKVIGIIE